MKYKFKKWQIITAIVLFILLWTNPSMKRFKDFRGENSYEGLKRTHNFGVLSIYTDARDKYIGFLWNFIHIGEDDNYYGTRPYRPEVKRPVYKRPEVRRPQRPSRYDE